MRAEIEVEDCGIGGKAHEPGRHSVRDDRSLDREKATRDETRKDPIEECAVDVGREVVEVVVEQDQIIGTSSEVQTHEFADPNLASS